MAINSRGETVASRAIKARRWARPDWIEQLGGPFQHQKRKKQPLPIKRKRLNGVKAKNIAPANTGQPDLVAQRARVKELTGE